MKDEVDSAIKFLLGFFKATVSEAGLEKFKQCLSKNMMEKYEHHWHPEKPQRGSAFRSITVDHDSIDPLISTSMQQSGLKESCLHGKFPKELSVWVDPMDVSYRFGDHGSVGILYSGCATEDASGYDSDSGTSSVSSSPSSSPCSSPPSILHQPSRQQNYGPYSMYYPHGCTREAFVDSPFPGRYYNGMQTTVA